MDAFPWYLHTYIHASLMIKVATKIYMPGGQNSNHMYYISLDVLPNLACVDHIMFVMACPISVLGISGETLAWQWCKWQNLLALTDWWSWKCYVSHVWKGQYFHPLTYPPLSYDCTPSLASLVCHKDISKCQVWFLSCSRSVAPNTTWRSEIYSYTTSMQVVYGH